MGLFRIFLGVLVLFYLKFSYYHHLLHKQNIVIGKQFIHSLGNNTTGLRQLIRSYHVHSSSPPSFILRNDKSKSKNVFQILFRLLRYDVPPMVSLILLFYLTLVLPSHSRFSIPLSFFHPALVIPSHPRSSIGIPPSFSKTPTHNVYCYPLAQCLILLVPTTVYCSTQLPILSLPTVNSITHSAHCLVATVTGWAPPRNEYTDFTVWTTWNALLCSDHRCSRFHKPSSYSCSLLWGRRRRPHL